MATTPNIEPKSNGFFNGATELAQYLVSQGKNDAKNELAVNQKLIEIDGVRTIGTAVTFAGARLRRPFRTTNLSRSGMFSSPLTA